MVRTCDEDADVLRVPNVKMRQGFDRSESDGGERWNARTREANRLELSFKA